MTQAAGFPRRVHLAAGHYATKAGSTLEVSGRFEGIFEVSFDWFEEGACCDCVAEAQPDEEGYLHWHCEECEGGRAKWEPATKEQQP